MKKQFDEQKAQTNYKDAVKKAILSFPKSCRYMSKKKRKELDDELYETTRMTIDNFTADDL